MGKVAAPFGILFLALARDVKPGLERLRAIEKEIEEAGVRVRVCIGEDSSHDGSRELVESICNESSSWRLVDTSGMAAIANRLPRMSWGRQTVRDAAASSFPEVKNEAYFVCVLDLDEVISTITGGSVLAAANCLQNDPEAFAYSAMSAPYYYDVLAYRGQGEVIYDFDSLRKQAFRQPWLYIKKYVSEIYPLQRWLSAQVGLLCRSSFNGFAVYKPGAFWSARYEAENVCEHVPLNLSIGQQLGQCIRLVDQVQTMMPNEHGPATVLGFVLRKIIEHLRKALRKAGPAGTLALQASTIAASRKRVDTAQAKVTGKSPA